MKEYLVENMYGEYVVTDHHSGFKVESLIEIPEGAEICYFFSADDLLSDEDNFTFYKNDITYIYQGDFDGWRITDRDCYNFILTKGKIVWERNKSKDKDRSTVNHPKHYTSDECGVEAIEITSLLPACLSNATKYIWREGKKDSSLQELEKALWYINYSIDNQLPSTVNDLTDSMHFEELITKVKKHWSGWKYVFIDAVYWGDQQQMKRAVEGMVADINTN